MRFAGSLRKAVSSSALVGVAVLAGLATLCISLDFSLLTFFTLLAVVVSFLLVHHTIRLFDFKRLTIPGLWYLSFLFTVYIPGLGVYAEGIRPYRDRFMYGMLSALITVPLGFLLLNLLVGFKADEIRAYFRKPIEDETNRHGLKLTFVLLFLGGLALVIFHLAQLQHIALVEMLRNPGAWTYIQDVRLEDVSSLNSPFAMGSEWLRGVLFPVVMASSLGFYLRSRQPAWLAIFLLSLSVGLGYAGLEAAKGPVSITLLILGFFVYLNRGGQIGKAAYVFWGAILLVFPFFVMMWAGGGEWADFGKVSQTLYWRMLNSNPSVAYKYFEIFPDEVPFLHGRSIQKLAWLMGKPYVDSTVIVFSHFFQHYSKGNSAGGAFFARFYADFGMLGVILGGVLTGIILQGIQVLVLRRAKTVVSMAVYATLLFGGVALNGESLPSVLLGRGMCFALLLPWMIKGLHWVLGGGSRRMAQATAMVSERPVNLGSSMAPVPHLRKGPQWINRRQRSEPPA